MADYGRCVDLINQAYGTIEEKLECASAGMWGNRPLYDFRSSYAGFPTPWVPIATRQAITPVSRGSGPKVRKCNSGCGCGGGGSVGGGGGVVTPGLPGGGGGGLLGGSSVGFSVNIGGLLLLLLFIMMIVRKSRS